MSRVLLPCKIYALGRKFAVKGYRLYAVGGLTRNSLLGYPPSDWDVTTDALPDDSLKIAVECGLKPVPKGMQFGTVEMIDEGAPTKWSVECTTFRKDTYAEDGSHRPKGVVFSDSIEDDAKRRDFTVNAIYATATGGELVDPVGGLADIKARLIRATSADPNVIMQDDGLRVMRMVRFACELGFCIEPATFAAAKAHAHGLKDIPAERIFGELSKILLSDARYNAPQPGGVSAPCRGMRLLHKLGALEYIIPELLEGVGVEQNPVYHAFDVFDHSLKVMSRTPPTLELRLAGLLHDIAKPVTKKLTGMMRGHENVGAELANVILERLKAPAALREGVVKLVKHHMYDLTGEARDSTLRKQIMKFGVDFTLKLADLREADFLGSGRQQKPVATAVNWRYLADRMRREKVPFDMKDLDITGDDLKTLGLSGPKLGEVKTALWLHTAVRPADNERGRLLRLAKGFM